jgi:hypothetical protein
MNNILVVLTDASVKPSAVTIKGPTVQSTFPWRNRRLLKNVKVRNMLIGIHPFFRFFIGILERRRKITAIIIKWKTGLSMKKRTTTNITYKIIFSSGSNTLPEK